MNAVNCVGVMGKGIALDFRQAFPDNYAAYRRACLAGEVQPGRAFVFERKGRGNPTHIVNVPTKRHWRDAARLSDVDAGLVGLQNILGRLAPCTAAVPALGCGNGGLRWAEVEPLVRKHLGDVAGVTVLLYAPRTETRGPD